MIYEDTLEEAAIKASYAIDYDNEEQRNFRVNVLKNKIRNILKNIEKEKMEYKVKKHSKDNFIGGYTINK